MFDFASDASGVGGAAAPIPNDPALAGAIYYCQTLWIESAAAGLACGAGDFGIVTSEYLTIQIE